MGSALSARQWKNAPPLKIFVFLLVLQSVQVQMSSNEKKIQFLTTQI